MSRTCRRVYVHDIVLAGIRDRPTVCRVMEMFWDEEEGQLAVGLRQFRTAKDVLGRHAETTWHGMKRVWEEVGARREVVSSAAILDLCNILSRDGKSAMMQSCDRTSGNATSDVYVGEGFVTRRPERRRSQGQDRGGSSRDMRDLQFIVIEQRWQMGGHAKEPLVHLRNGRVHHNKENLPFAGVPIIVYTDAFNAWSMGTQASQE